MHVLFNVVVGIRQKGSKKCFRSPQSPLNGINKNSRLYSIQVHKSDSILLVKYLSLQGVIPECNSLHVYQFPELSEVMVLVHKHSCVSTHYRSARPV